MSATVVTALYNINREKFDGRRMDQYFDWFKRTLTLNCPMIIYCEESLNSFIAENRPSNLKTKIINQKLEEIPYYYLKPKIDKILENSSYVSKIQDPSRIECKTSLYSIIQYSKFPWVEHAAANDFFASDYYIWMDAGLSRLIPDVDYTKEYPGINFMSQTKSFSGKALFQVYMLPYQDLFNAERLTTDYFYDNRSYVMGGMFGVDKIAIKNIKQKVEDVLVKEMIEQNKFNNEQIAIGYLLKKYKDDFLVLSNNNQLHRNFELVYQTFL